MRMDLVDQQQGVAPLPRELRPARVTKYIQTWNILTDDVSVLAKRFELISLKSLKRGALDELWEKTTSCCRGTYWGNPLR